MKTRISFLAAIAIFGLVGPLQAQLAPTAPFGPTSAEQCQVFSRQVNEYWARVSADHEACLASHRADRSDEHPGSMTCSRSACQGLHGQLYGGFSLAGKTHQQVQQDDVSACYNTVREAQKEQARAQQEEADRKTARAHEEKQRERQKLQPDSASAQKSKAAAAQQAAAKASSHDSAAARPASPTQPPAGSINVQETKEQERAWLAARESERQQNSEQALQEMIDPFNNSGKQVAQGKSTMSSDGMVDPFSIENHKSSGLAPKDQVQAYSLAVEEQAVETGIKSTNRAIEEEVAAAAKVLDGNDLKAFENHAARAKAVVDGFGTALKAVHYSKDIALVAVANDDRERARAGSDLFLDVIKDGLMAVTKRISLVTSEILEGPVGWVAGSTFDSTEEHLDAQYVVSHDQQFSFQEREKALDELYSQYDHHKDLWGKRQVQNLIRLTKQLYESPDNPNIHVAKP